MNLKFRTAFLALAVAVVCLGVSSASRVLAQPASGLPPLIDRELFFGDPEISGAQISPDGKFIAFVKPLKGTRNIWVKRTDEPFDKAKPVTADTQRPIPSVLLEPRRQVHPVRPGQSRRRELSRLRRKSCRHAGRGSGSSGRAQSDGREGRSRSNRWLCRAPIRTRSTSPSTIETKPGTISTK